MPKPSSNGLPSEAELIRWLDEGMTTPEALGHLCPPHWKAKSAVQFGGAGGEKGDEKISPKSVRSLVDEPAARVTLRLVISPMRLVSEANQGGRLRAKIGRKTAVKEATWKALSLVKPPSLPVVVRLTRLGGNELDREENLPMALKAVKDVVAEWLGLPDDRDRRVRWVIRQRAAYACGCEIVIQTKEDC